MAEPAAAPRGDLSGSRLLAFLPKTLLRPEAPLKAIAVGWLTAFIPSILLSVLVASLVPEATRPNFDLPPAVALGALVFFAPLLETLIMGGVLLLLVRFVSPAVAVLLSSLGWGIAHSLSAPVWGLVIWWPFLVFSTLFLVWRQRGILAAIAVPATVHGLQNLLPALAIASGIEV